MVKKTIIVSICLIVAVFICWGALYGSSYIKWFAFERQDALSEWKEKVFQGRVLYEVRPDPQKGYLLARSNQASSGLFYKISFSPKKNPYISWSWKVSQFPAKAAEAKSSKRSWIERDDYAVRVYVIFPALIFTNTKCLEYVWAEDIPAGTVLTSPFFNNIKLIVLESGAKNLGQWVSEERNIFNDYKLAFKREPSVNAGAIALMTDADNTQSQAEGCYADIKVGYPKAILTYPQYKKAETPKPKEKKEPWRAYLKHLKLL